MIGDAFVYAANHDRFFNDGRIRDAYSAGDIALPPGWTPNNRIATVPIPGFYAEAQSKFFEVENKGISVGNNAWVMAALLGLYKKTLDAEYLQTAGKIGQFINSFKNTTGQYQGYQGGLDSNIESSSTNPIRRTWASTEHNLDVFAAFSEMYRLTNELQWQTGAQHAKTFIEAMWNSSNSCYRTGTIDPNTLNNTPGQLPLDPQSWSVIATPPCMSPIFQQPIFCAEMNHKKSHDGFDGFDFNNDTDGVWFEGTAQMGTAFAFASPPQSDKAFAIRKELRRIQDSIPFGDSLGIAAACHDLVSSGFDFKLYRRLHVAATSWNVFAQLQFNPYYQSFSNSGCPPLPLALLFFKGERIEDNTMLTWATATEQNSKEFIIERSYDGRTYSKIASIPAAGNSTLNTYYRYNDNEAASLEANILYYRLKQVDLDGKYEYSSVVTISNNQLRSVAIVKANPNPFKHSITLQIENLTAVSKSDKVELYSMEGKLLYQRSLANRGRGNVYLNDLPVLSPGAYLLKTMVNGKLVITKVIRQE